MQLFKGNNHRGAVGVAMVIAMVLLQLVVIAAVVGGSRDQELTINRLNTTRAFYATEGGMNMGIREIRLGVDEDLDGAYGTISDDGNAANDPVIGSAKVYVTKTTAGIQTTLISNGGLAQAYRRAVATIGAASGSGLWAEYFAGPALPSPPALQLSDIDWDDAPLYTTVVAVINMGLSAGEGWPGGPTGNWGKRFTGKIDIATAGDWTFYTSSDDGSRLWIDSILVVDNDGVHPMLTASGIINLATGEHDFEVQWFDAAGSFACIVEWEGPGGAPPRQIIPSPVFSH